MSAEITETRKLIVVAVLATFSVLACAQTVKQEGEDPTKGVQSEIKFFADGSVEVRDGNGELIKGIPQDQFFSCSDARCDGVKVSRVLRITPTVIGIQVEGSHYEIKKIGGKIYKIPLPH